MALLKVRYHAFMQRMPAADGDAHLAGMGTAPPMETLEQLFARNASCAGCENGTDKLVGHSYVPVYAALIEARRAAVRTVVEIGTASGASAVAWAAYFPNARVHAVDVSLKDVVFGKDEPRIAFHELDSTHEPGVARLLRDVGPVDVLVDDGSHRPEDQLRTLELFAAGMSADGGVYFVEDLNPSWAPPQSHFDRLRAAAERRGLAHARLYDLRAVKNRFDDLLAVFAREKM